jgi:predicted SprT family Zn-dependent metalloprotease
MGNELKKRTYECKCGALTKEYVWDNDLDKTKVKCSECSKQLTNKNLVSNTTNWAASIRTPTKNR